MKYTSVFLQTPPLIIIRGILVMSVSYSTTKGKCKSHKNSIHTLKNKTGSSLKVSGNLDTIRKTDILITNHKQQTDCLL